MPLNTLFCRQGVDSNLRFVSISLTALMGTLLAYLLIGSHFLIVIVAAAMGAINALSASRRQAKAQLPVSLAMTTGQLLFGISLFYEAQVLLMLSAVAIMVASMVYIVSRPMPQLQRGFDAFGYSGPLAQPLPRRRRVEPTLAGERAQSFVEVEGTPDDEQYTQPSFEPASKSTDFSAMTKRIPAVGDGLKSAFEMARRRPRLAVVAAGSCMLILAVLLWLVDTPATDDVLQQTVQPVAEEQIMSSKISQAKMPDGFTVMLEDNLLMLNWLGERGEPGEIWSLATAKGDRTCRVLKFNNGASYRPMRVSLEADSSTLARFSPLDTAAILKDIAMRGSLTLCGYQFSLKGSQAALAKEPAFRPYL